MIIILIVSFNKVLLQLSFQNLSMKFIKLFLLFFFISNIFSEEWIIEPSPNAQDEIQEALILAEPGDVISLSKGTYELNHGLSLDVSDVSIVGKGMYETILDFSNQETGAQGLLVTSDNVLMQDFAIENAKGDAIKSLSLIHI